MEILSPVNKREGHDAYHAYRRKRRAILRSDVHLIEIDLLRVGERSPIITPLAPAPYFIFVYRGLQPARVAIWPLPLQEPIPVTPVPLDLGTAIRSLHERAAYELRIDYSQPPPYPDLFSVEDKAWLEDKLHISF